MKRTVIRLGMDDPVYKPRPCSPAKLEALRKARAAQGPVLGERNGNAKLTEAQVKKIRALRESGERPTVLAARYCVTYNLIWRILKRRNWTHV